MDLDFNNMNDEQFRREFLRFMSFYQKDMEKFIKAYYGNRNPFTSFNDTEEFFNRLGIDINEVNFDGIKDDSSEWETKSWASPNGLTNFRAFRQRLGTDKNLKETDTLDLLKEKLNLAIIDENYENAAKIKKLMDSIKKDEVKKKN